MDKIDFLINLISLQEKNKENHHLYQEHWRRPRMFSDGSYDNDYWTYFIAGVDGIGPEIVLKDDKVYYTDFNESDEAIIYTYEEFLNTHINNK